MNMKVILSLSILYVLGFSVIGLASVPEFYKSQGACKTKLRQKVSGAGAVIRANNGFGDICVGTFRLNRVCSNYSISPDGSAKLVRQYNIPIEEVGSNASAAVLSGYCLR